MNKLSKREKRRLAKERKREERRSRERKNSLMKAVAILAVAGLLIWGGYKAWVWIDTPVEEIPEDTFQVRDDDWVKGSPQAQVTLIEYADFQCPACAFYASQTGRLLDDYPDEVRLVFRHFPLVSIHANGTDAAKAAEAAGIQGKFWEMHDLLFENQSEWESEGSPKELFADYAEGLGLDRDRFLEDFDSTGVEESVNASFAEAGRLGLTSTPSLFINGEKIRNPRNYDDFKALIEEQISSNDES
jgi:protein-disulfide isomerase